MFLTGKVPLKTHCYLKEMTVIMMASLDLKKKTLLGLEISPSVHKLIYLLEVKYYLVFIN